jgi:hypothetical protein
MICHQDKRHARRQIFAAANFQSMCAGKIQPRNRSPKKTGDRTLQSHFAAQAQPPLFGAQSEIMRWFEAPLVHR